MKQSLILKEKEEIIKKPEENLRRWKPTSESTPPGAHWFRVIPYNDGFIPYDKTEVVLYYKENAEIKMYVRTFNVPAEFTCLGYLYHESPEEILGNQPVFYCSFHPQYKHEPLFFDLQVDNTIFSNMPNHSSIVFCIKRVTDLEEQYDEILENPDKLYVSEKHELKIFNLLSSGEYSKLRENQTAYSINIIISSPSKEAYFKLRDLLLTSIIKPKATFKEDDNNPKPWSELIKDISKYTDDKKSKSNFKNLITGLVNRKKSNSYFIATEQVMRNYIVIPDLCPTIPRGTIPTIILSRPNGFRIGVGPDFAEFRLKVEDLFNHCAIVNPNPDILANLIKNVSIHYPVIVLSSKPISSFLLQKGIKCRVYQSVSVNIFDDPSKINLLSNVFEMLTGEKFEDVFGIAPSNLQSIFEIASKTLGPLSKSTKNLLENYLSYGLCHNIDKTVLNAFSYTIEKMHFIYPSYESALDYTNVPIQEIVQSNVTVFEDPNLPYEPLILKILTEAIHSKKALFIVLDDSNYYPIPNIFKFKDFNIFFVLCLQEPNEEILRKVGLVFKVNNDEAIVELEGKAVSITIDKLDDFPTSPLPSPTLPKPKPTLKLEKIFGPAIKFIEPIYPFASHILYKIYKSGKVRVNDPTNRLKNTLNFLESLDAIRIQGEYVEYNEGFEKWFKSAIPSIEGFKIIRAIVDYYFSKNLCVVPVKQTPGTERPDLLAIPFSKEYFNCFKAIPIEVELSLNKGEKSLHQALKNMSKNPEFPIKHVIAPLKFKDVIFDLYNKLDDKSRVKILLFDGERIIDHQFFEFVPKDESKKPSQNKKRKTKIPSDPKSPTLFRFVVHKSEVKEEKKAEDLKVNECKTELSKPNEPEGILIDWKGKRILIEKNPNTERIQKLLSTKNRTIVIDEKENILKVIDEKNIVLASAKILKIYS